MPQHPPTSAEPDLFDPEAERPPELANSFLALACVDYGRWHPGLAERARRLLAESPELARADLCTAAAVGDVDAVRDFIAADPAAGRARGGPYGWEPLLYACYSRLDSPDPSHSTLETARLLLAAGADANAGFLWKGNLPPFTALCGAFGDGESSPTQPPHRHCLALARLLLEAGADPNDGQLLYNRHFRADDAHLELLLAHGLGRPRGGPWYRRFGERLESPAQLLVEELWHAARANLPARARLLLAHGVEVNRPGRRDGRTAYQAAMRAGHRQIAELLVEHGAEATPLPPHDAFAAACIAGRGDEVRALLAASPDLVQEIGHHRRVELLHRAVEGNHADGLRLMAELGFELSDCTSHDNVGVNLAATPLHNAAWFGNLELVRLLLELGADPGVRDPEYRATPIGWAAYNKQRDAVAALLPHADLFDAIGCDGVERAEALLAADSTLARAADADGDPAIFRLHGGLARLDELIAVLRRHGADFGARDRRGRSLAEVAAENRDHALLERLLPSPA